VADPDLDRGSEAAAQRALLIAGPTASGKSALALALAERLGGVVINADSMQVYRDLRVLTARPSQADEARAPHRLYGVLDPAERCSAGRWAGMVRAALREAEQAGRVPILVGGTGLYFRTLTTGLSPMPEIGPEARAEAGAMLTRLGAEGAFAALQERDPESAAALPSRDPQRVARALEVLLETGRGLASWQGEAGEPVLKGEYLGVVLEAERGWLYARCDARFEAMLGEGGLAEAKALMARGLDPSLPAMKALGVPQLMAYLRGEQDLESARSEAQTLTRRFAKRQMTWFRNQTPDWERVDAQQTQSAVEKILTKFARRP